MRSCLAGARIQDAFASAAHLYWRRMHTLKGRAQSARGLSWWRVEVIEWFICVGRQFKLHVVKHEVCLSLMHQSSFRPHFPCPMLASS